MSLLSFFGLAPDPTDKFWYSEVAPRTRSGVSVTESTAMNYSVCWAATRLLAGTTGWLPFNLYKRQSGGGAVIDTRHPVHRIIHDQPNRDMGAMMFRARGVNQQVNAGNFFAEIVRTRGGTPYSLEPIHHTRIPPQNVKREDGRLVYYVNNQTAEPTRIEQDDMFHVPSIISDDGIYGKGVIAFAREAIGKAIATQGYGASSMNNPVPPVAIKNAKFKDKEERAEYRRQWEEVHAGSQNAGKPALLPLGAEIQQLGYSLQDTQFIESQQFDVEEIARWYGVPPHLIGHLLRATFNNIEELGISFVKYSLIQWLKLWEQEVWRKLLTENEQSDYYAKFVVDALERGNLTSRTEAGVKKFFNGLWSLNDWAQQEDMNPIAETVQIDGQTVRLGDMHFVQQAMIPLAQAAKGQQTQPATKQPSNESGNGLSVAALEAVRDEFRREFTGLKHSHDSAAEVARIVQAKLAAVVLNDVMARMVSLEVNAVKRVAEKPTRFDQRLREFYDKHKLTMRRSLAAPMSACLNGTAAASLDALIVRHVDESLRQLDALCDCTADQLSVKVEECVSRWHEERATVTL